MRLISKASLGLLREFCLEPRERARTQPFAQIVAMTLRNTKKIPQCHLSDGTNWHGPTFTNFDIPSDAEITDMENVA